MERGSLRLNNKRKVGKASMSRFHSDFKDIKMIKSSKASPTSVTVSSDCALSKKVLCRLQKKSSKKEVPPNPVGPPPVKIPPIPLSDEEMKDCTIDLSPDLSLETEIMESMELTQTSTDPMSALKGISTLDVDGSSRFLNTHSLPCSPMSSSKSPSGRYNTMHHGLSSKQYTEDELRMLALRTLEDYDMLMFYWYFVFGQDWVRALMISAFDHALGNINESIIIKDALNDDDLETNDLYEKYCDRLESMSDALYVFNQVKVYPDSERFFKFGSFATRLLFVVNKLGLLPFYEGQILPRPFQTWRSLVKNKIQHYLLNVIRLDEESYHRVRPDETGYAQLKRKYIFMMAHDNVLYPRALPIVLEPRSFHEEFPRVEIDINQVVSVQALNEFIYWYNDLPFRNVLDYRASVRWPQKDMHLQQLQYHQLQHPNVSNQMNQYYQRYDAQFADGQHRYPIARFPQNNYNQEWTSFNVQQLQCHQPRGDAVMTTKKAWTPSTQLQMSQINQINQQQPIANEPNPLIAKSQCPIVPIPNQGNGGFQDSNSKAAAATQDGIKSMNQCMPCMAMDTYSEFPRVCRFWARSGRCKWGKNCYDLHHGIKAYLDNDEVDSIASILDGIEVDRLLGE